MKSTLIALALVAVAGAASKNSRKNVDLVDLLDGDAVGDRAVSRFHALHAYLGAGLYHALVDGRDGDVPSLAADRRPRAPGAFHGRHFVLGQRAMRWLDVSFEPRHAADARETGA